MRLATLCAIALMTSAAQGQEYLANDPIWLQHSVCGVPAPCIANDGFNYFTAGDSVIESVTWTKVLRAGVVTLNWQSMPPPQPGCSGTTPYGTGFHGVWLIRQQDRQLRIWADDADQLLHEFDPGGRSDAATELYQLECGYHGGGGGQRAHRYRDARPLRTGQ
ncbi:MAG: hypothetical protein IPM46_11500 [Flavobacteriales bacterium]|nr:hypothetical protein [Flavobacteriales bacterium]